MFYFFYKIIFHLKKEKDNNQSMFVCFNFFHETINTHNLETANHNAHDTVNENTFVDQSKCMYYPNYC